MPRGPRLDQFGALHHVIARGIERREIFRDDFDREDFLERLARLALERALDVYAWALMPNHVHLLVRTGTRALASSMRSLLGGYATHFNRRHDRPGHLFQNRYKSILCEEESYFLTLVAYIHLNPLRAGLVGSLADLDSYRWTGHSAILGRYSRRWQKVDFVLEQLSRMRPGALRRYRELLAGRLVSGDPVDLDGGGLRRSWKGLQPVEVLPRGRECFRSDERILGRSAFARAVLEEARVRDAHSGVGDPGVEEVIGIVSRALGTPAAGIASGGRSRLHARAREGIAFLWIVALGRSGRALARHIGLTPSGAYAAASRGHRERELWLQLLGEGRRRAF